MAGDSNEDCYYQKVRDYIRAGNNGVIDDDSGDSSLEKGAAPVERRELSRYQVVRESLLAGEYGVPPLPERVVDKIIDDARYWNWVSKEIRGKKSVLESRQPYLSIEVPVECHQVKLIVMECEGHDLGWSSYPNDKGTRGNSRTLGVLSVLSSEGVELFKPDCVESDVDRWVMLRKECGVSDQQDLTPGKRLVMPLHTMFSGCVNDMRYAKLMMYFV